MTRRLLLSYLTLALLVLVGLEVPLGTLYAHGELSDLSRTVERNSVMVAELVEEDIQAGKTPALTAFVAHYAQCMGGRVVVFDRGGRLLTDSGTYPDPGSGPAAKYRLGNSPTSGTSSPRASGTGSASASGAVAPVTAADKAAVSRALAAALRNRSSVGMLRDHAGNDALVSVAEPVTVASQVRGAVWVTSTTADTNARTQLAWLLLAGIGVGVLVVVALVGFALARWITRPVRALERATTQLANGSLADLPPADLGPPELRRLAASFNRTATRLQRLLRAQRSFAAEASHQLKTPLAALRLRVETLEFDLDARAHAGLDAAVAEIDRLTRMVQGLLALARMEDSATEPETVDLDEVLRDRAETWVGFAAEQHITIGVSGPRAGQVRAIPGALEQIVDNLLANALQFAPPGSTITLTTASAHGQGQGQGHGHGEQRKRPYGDEEALVEFHVIDQGPGMSEEQRGRAFDRFWRAPDSVHEGSGLGLAIVQQLVHAGGGEISLRDAPGGGLDAVVQLRPAEADRRLAERASA
ncbi:sensor histidine kinase [Streptomyces sp. NPDC088400]|uniref:sensor histidine kinase n=1 Tax=Streptomyces sp. NPDC088400 TaxID=3365861 RepID=UPI00380A6F48